ncbi:MAG: tannase/feruloyl esterase family alpha/beta hydrolase [Gammaproteobacteria bacterium]|nr:tannase/feruloyl esterase family alpha/beta hydrolase [Gammaproteobacteria bacterium]
MVEPLENPVPHCKLTGKLGREIGFSVWLPVNWNGKFLMGGGGGFVGSIQNQALALGALQRGYATAGTDTGHQANGIDGSWALHNLERIVNYGHVAIHRVSETSKHIADSNYGKWPDRSYFAGCSNGGRQAMAFSQRYPNDFNAIIAGAPAFDFGGIAAAFVNVSQHMYPDMDNLTTPLLSSVDRSTLAKAVLAQCDALDGLEDGIMNDPRECDFDPAALDLPEEKIAAIRAVYDGPQNASGPVFHGWPFGGEDEDGGWGSWLAGPGQQTEGAPPSAAFGFGVDLMRYMVEHDPKWRYEDFSFDGYRERVAVVESVLSAKDPNLDEFRQAGGKLLLYHGWSDSALSALATIDYVDAVYARDPAARDDVRLFLLPGVSHCAGGPGPWMVDYLDVIERWVTSGEAPDELIAGFIDESGSRRLCAYPAKASFIEGNDRNPSSFECR